MIARPRFAFLDASHDDSSTSRNFRRGLDTDLVEFDVTDGRFPNHFDYDDIVISSPLSSVYQDGPWIRNLVSQITDAGKHGVPLLSVRFGHQVVAAALDGIVEDMGAFKLGCSGIERTHPSDGSDIPAGIGECFTVFTSRGDRVMKLPSGANLLAESKFNIHASRRNHAFGAQFHPEYDTDTAEAIARQKDFLPDERIRSVVNGITPESCAAACEARRLFDNLVTYVSRTDAGSVESAA